MKMSESRILSSSPMLLVLLSLLMASFIDTTAGQIGVCYGRLSEPRPNPSDVVNLYKQRNIKRMRIYDPDPETLNALRGSNIEVVLGVPNTDLGPIANSQTVADTWISDNVKNYDGVIFRYITVGNEVKPSELGNGILLQAMQNIERAVSGAGLTTKVSTVIDMVSTTDTYPPSNGRFTDEYRIFLQPVINFLVSKQSPLHVNVYTYFGYRDNDKISLEYALFEPNTEVHDGPYIYRNLFDANLDSVYAALEKTGGEKLHVVVSESGWPTNGGEHGSATENAKPYVNNLIQHVKNGTPRRPEQPIETYIFALFDENQKSPGIENYWGMFYPNLQPKYDVNFN